MVGKRFMAVVAIALIAVFLCGCNLLPQRRPQGQEANEGKKAKILVSMGNTAIDNYEYLKSLLQEKGKEAKLEFIWLDARNDALRQASDLNQAQKEKAKVVIVEPVEADMLKSALEELQKQGIKIICLGNMPGNMPVDAYISPDFRRAGEIQGQQVLEKAGTSGQVLNILILRGPENNKAADRMLEGNLAVLQGHQKVGSIQVEAVEGWNASTAFSLVQNKLKQGARPHAILAHSPELTAGVLQAVQQQALQGQVQTYGMGTQVQAIEFLGQGKHTAEVDFMPEMLAQTLVDAAQSLSKGEAWQYESQVQNGTHNVPAKFIPIRSITVDNLYLLKERMEKMKKSEGKKESQQGSGSNQGSGGGDSGSPPEEGSASGGEGKQGQSSQGQGQGQKKTTLKIKTKDGNTFQMEIAGEVESVEVKGSDQQGGSQQGGGQEGQGGQEQDKGGGQGGGGS